MYYYYYYYGELASEVSIKIKTSKSENNQSLEELNQLIEAITELHKGVIFYSQPEYKAENRPCKLADIELLHYHQLKITKIENNSPYVLDLTFSILAFSHNPYWAMWKILISTCKRYGSNTEDAKFNFKQLTSTIDKIVKDLGKVTRVTPLQDCELTGLIGAEKRDTKSTKKFLFDSVNNVLTDKTFSKYYNSMCAVMIGIDSAISICTDLGINEALIDLIPSDIE